MMTGAILGGSSVQQAARLQMVIMFMISSSTALASIVTTFLALGVVVDAEHRVRTDRIDVRPHAVYRARDRFIARVVQRSKERWAEFRASWGKDRRHDGYDRSEETDRMLASP